jgi:Variant SH3 domain
MSPSFDEVIVREAYVAQYRDPIVFRHGDAVQVQRADAEFTEWLWCRGPDGKEGWVHRSFLSESQRPCGRDVGLLSQRTYRGGWGAGPCDSDTRRLGICGASPGSSRLDAGTSLEYS